MQLPRVKIQFLNGLLGTVGESNDGLMAIMGPSGCTDKAFTSFEPMEIRSVDDMTALGITEANSPLIYNDVKAFYDEAPTGTKLILYCGTGLDPSKDRFDKDYSGPGSLRHLIEATNGKLRGIGVCDNSFNGKTDSLTKAQAVAEWATSDLYAPLFIAFKNQKATDISSLDCDRICAVAGSYQSGSTEYMCMGTFLGRVASTAVHRNIGRVKDGSLAPTKLYFDSTLVDESSSKIADYLDKHTIVPRKHVGRSGYFFADDPMAVAETSDFAHLTNRRVIDKAYRIAYDALLDMLLDDIDINQDGTIQTAVAKSWQQTVENAINRQMTANDELSADESGSGCEVYVDETQNIISTGKVVITIKVRPKGYARYIDVNLGFNVTV